MTPAVGGPVGLRVRIWPALGAVYLLWGSTFVAVRVMVVELPPLLMSGTRFLLAGLVLMVVVAAARGTGALRLTRRQLAGTCAVALCMIPGANALVVLGQQTVPAGLAAVLGAVTPCWIVLLRLLHGDRVRRATAAGVALGLGGVVVLLDPTGGGPAELPGLLLVLGGSVLWALGTFFVPRLPLQPDVLASAASQMVVGGAVGVLAGLAAGERLPRTAEVSAQAWWAFGYLVVFGSLLGFAAYTWLLLHATVSTASTVSYGIPLVAVVLGVLLLGESSTTAATAGAAAVLASCVVVVTAERAVARSAADVAEAEASGVVGREGGRS